MECTRTRGKFIRVQLHVLGLNAFLLDAETTPRTNRITQTAKTNNTDKCLLLERSSLPTGNTWKTLLEVSCAYCFLNPSASDSYAENTLKANGKYFTCLYTYLFSCFLASQNGKYFTLLIYLFVFLFSCLWHERKILHMLILIFSFFWQRTRHSSKPDTAS